MKKDYYKLLIEKNLIDVFRDIPELSFSFKRKILENLLSKYNSYIVNLALLDYEEKYIRQNRVNFNKLKNTLIYLCKKNYENFKDS